MSTAANLGAIALANAMVNNSAELDFDEFKRQLQNVLELEWARSSQAFDNSASKEPVDSSNKSA